MDIKKLEMLKQLAVELFVSGVDVNSICKKTGFTMEEVLNTIRCASSNDSNVRDKYIELCNNQPIYINNQKSKRK